MKPIYISVKVKSLFRYKTRELIFRLNQELEGEELLVDAEVRSYLLPLSRITDIGKRYQVIMSTHAYTLCE